MNNELLNLPAGFKMTELGPLPEEWQVVRLGEVFDIQQGKSLSPKSRIGSRKRPFLRTANVLWGYIDLSTVDEMHFEEAEEKRLALNPGDLLVCEGGDIGRTAMWEGQIPVYLYQNHLHRLRTRHSDAYPLFYMYWMQAAWTLLGLYGGAGNKTTIPNLSQSRLSSFPIPLPPLPEQRAIAHVLRTMQEAKEATGRVIAALRDLKKSLMRHLFTYGPVPAVGAKHFSPLQETEIGPLPAHWQVVRLGEVVEKLFAGGDVPKDRFSKIANQQFNIPVYTNGTEEAALRGFTDYPVVNMPAITISARGTIGYCAVRLNPFYPAIRLIVAIPKASMDIWFLKHAIDRIDFRLHFDKSPIPQLTVPMAKNIPLPLPPLPEQQEIARILRAVDGRIQAEEAYARALDDLFKTLLHDLMTARRRLPPEYVAQFATANGTNGWGESSRGEISFAPTATAPQQMPKGKDAP